MSIRHNGAHPWVQPIIVSKAGTHEATVRHAAQASYGVHRHCPDLPEWDLWLSGPFTKSVRRADFKQMQAVVTWADENKIPYEAFESGDSAALALPPMRYEDLPKCVGRLQVSGTDFPRAEPVFDYGPALSIAVDESLTTGKAAAQTAHAVWAFFLRQGDVHDVPGNEWTDHGSKLNLTFVDQAELMALRASPQATPIIDAGLTEIAPGSLTAVALGLKG